MLSIQSLAAEVKNYISLDVREFERFLSHKQIYDHQSILKVISDIMASDIFTHQQRQLAAVSLKFLLSKRLNENYQLYLNICWNQYFTFFIERQPGDQIQWIYLSLTVNALRYLVQELSAEVGVKSIQKFRTTSLVGKVMLMCALKDHDEVQITNLYLFFTQTIDQFLTETQEFFNIIHQNQNRNNNGSKQSQQVNINTILFERDILKTIHQWVQFLQSYSGQGWKVKLDQLAYNKNLVSIIKQEMKLEIIQQNGKYFYKISEEMTSFCDELIENSIKSNKNKLTQKMLENILDIKSYALKLLQNLLKTFSCMQGLQQFDTIPILSFIQHLTPILSQYLHKNERLKNIYVKSDYSELYDVINTLLTSIFSLLNVSATFIFLMQTLSQLQKPILYSIFTSYLQATTIQLQSFQDDDQQQFIKISENFIQKQPAQLCQTPKQACGNFMQSYLKLINTVQVQFIEFLADSFKFHVIKEKSYKLKQIQSQGFKIPSIQTIYSILTRIYFFTDKSNQYFLNFVYNNFINQDFVFQFKKVQKARFLLFVQYTYEQYFEDNVQQGTKFLKFAYQTKDKSDVEFKIFLQFLKSSFRYGIAQSIWEYLVNEIESTQKLKLLSLIQKLLESYIRKLPSEKILILAKNIKNKIKRYVKENRQKLIQSGYCHNILYKCLQIIQILAGDKKLITGEIQIMGEIMQIIDFFNENKLQNYEFSCQVVNIFNCIIEVQQVIPVEFQKYLSAMSKIVQKNKLYGPLLETYYLILLKGRQSFQKKPQFLEIIKSQIEQKLLSRANRTQQIIIESVFLLQNIYLVYPHLIKQNRNLFHETVKIYEAEKQSTNPNPKIVASILLLWMAGQFAFGNYNLGKLKDCKIQIFKEQFGRMFALNLKKLIQKYYRTQNLGQLLKLSIKLLDYQHFYKNQINYRGPVFTLKIFKKYLQLDSFQQINQAIQFLRLNLSRQRFFQSFQIFEKDIGIETVNELLKKRFFNNRTGRNILTVKKN